MKQTSPRRQPLRSPRTLLGCLGQFLTPTAWKQAHPPPGRPARRRMRRKDRRRTLLLRRQLPAVSQKTGPSGILDTPAGGRLPWEAEGMHQNPNQVPLLK
jgi:hypothetical protein